MKVHCVKEVALAATGWKPESTTVPSALVKFVQGEAKVDWVTVWFFDKLDEYKLIDMKDEGAEKPTYNWKETVSPVTAVTLRGRPVSP